MFNITRHYYNKVARLQLDTDTSNFGFYVICVPKKIEAQILKKSEFNLSEFEVKRLNSARYFCQPPLNLHGPPELKKACIMYIIHIPIGLRDVLGTVTVGYSGLLLLCFKSKQFLLQLRDDILYFYICVQKLCSYLFNPKLRLVEVEMVLLRGQCGKLIAGNCCCVDWNK